MRLEFSLVFCFTFLRDLWGLRNLLISTDHCAGQNIFQEHEERYLNCGQKIECNFRSPTLVTVPAGLVINVKPGKQIGPRPCTIFCFALKHSALITYPTRLSGLCWLNTQLFCFSCARSRPKRRTKAYSKELWRISYQFPSVYHVVCVIYQSSLCIVWYSFFCSRFYLRAARMRNSSSKGNACFAR